MATYPKTIKPWRGYPNANVVHAIRAHVKQVGADSSLGQFGLTMNGAKHIGTIPRGALILPVTVHVLVAFTAAVTIAVGPQPPIGIKDGVVTSAQIAPQTIGFKPALSGGTLIGYTAVDLPLYILAEAAVPAAGELDLIIPFYINKD